MLLLRLLLLPTTFMCETCCCKHPSWYGLHKQGEPPYSSRPANQAVCKDHTGNVMRITMSKGETIEIWICKLQTDYYYNGSGNARRNVAQVRLVPIVRGWSHHSFPSSSLPKNFLFKIPLKKGFQRKEERKQMKIVNLKSGKDQKYYQKSGKNMLQK